MVSPESVTSDSENIIRNAGTYLSKFEGVASSWQGTSHDSLANQCTSFKADMEKVGEQLASFAEAAKLYKEYEDVKKKYNDTINTYNNSVRFSGDQDLINQYKTTIDELETKKDEYPPKIQAALSKAGSFKLSATALASTATSTAATATTDANGNIVVTGEGGQFIPDDMKGVYGHITIDGKTFTIYNQSQISGWGQCCNRAAAASIASAYASYSGESVDVAHQSKNGLGSNQNVTNSYFNKFGLSANVNRINGSYDKVKNDIVNQLSQGNYVMFDLDHSNVHGQSGQKWTSSRHWLSLLDIKKVGNDYAVFVSDSGHRGSTKDYGYGTGWYSINEFTGQKIASYTVVSENGRRT